MVRTNRRRSIAAGLGVIACVLAGCSSGPRAEPKPTGAGGSYAFWPQFPDEPRIQFLRSFSGSGDVAPTPSGGFQKLIFGSEGAGEEGIQKPYGVAAKDGRVYVCDIRNASVTVLDIQKRQTRLIGTTGANALGHPVDVAVSDDDMLYVADNERGAVLVYDASERFAKIFGYAGMKPVALAVHDDRLYVCDMNAHAVEVFDRRDGKRIGTIGSVGDEDGQFRVPLGVDTDAAGNVYVSDMMRCRVQRFSPDGKFISAMGTLGDYAGSFARPKQVAVDREGIQYVVDAAFQNIQMFDDQSRLLMSFGAAGDFPGAMNLPVGVCVADTGLDYFKQDYHPGFQPRRLIFVTNQFGPNKVSVYALGDRKKEYALADLASSTVAVSQGVGATEERLNLASPGGVEPGGPVDEPAAEEGALQPEPKEQPKP